MDWTSDLAQSKRKGASEWSAVEVPVDSRVIKSLFAWSESKLHGLSKLHMLPLVPIASHFREEVCCKNSLDSDGGYDRTGLFQHVKKFDRLLAKCYKTSFRSSLV